MTLAANPPIEIPLERMTGAQKWQLLQALTEDLDASPQIEEGVPAWHLDVLAEREKQLEAGQVEVIELDDFVQEMRRTMPHQEVLRERMEKIESGQAVWHDFDEAFENLLRKLA